VKGEVCGCDLVALRGDEPPIVAVGELKLGFNLELVLQGINRTAACDEVWLAVRMAVRGGRENDPRVRKLCRLLGFGLLGVLSTGRVEVLVEPGPWRPRRDPKRRSRLVNEHRRRIGDPATGGTTKVPIMTAYRQQAPVDFVVWPLTVSLAALCGRDVGIRPRAHDDWTERLALWAALIGPPSTMKTPALAEGTRVLTRIAAKLREDYLAELEQWKQDCLAEKQANGKHAELPEKPVFQRVWTAEATIEKLAMIIGEQSPRGVAIVRDELAGLIFGLDRYHPGSGGDRQFLLQAYSGGAYVVDRMSRPSVFIDDLLLNIAGGVQPERARELFGEGVDDGLAARFLTVFPGLPGRFRVIDRYPDMAARHALDGVADTLFRTHWGDLLHTDTFRPTPFCTLEDEGRELFSDWHEQVVARARSADLESRQSARIGKYPGLAARLMLLFHLVEWAAGRCRTILRVTAETTAHVLDLMDTYVQPMEDRVYLAYADSVVTAAGRRVARWILTKGVERFTPRDVRQLRYEGVCEHGEAERVVEWLCAMGWAREEDARVRVGRPSQTYLVNPGVKGFAN
jgi:hypothetical protein